MRVPPFRAGRLVVERSIRPRVPAAADVARPATPRREVARTDLDGPVSTDLRLTDDPRATLLRRLPTEDASSPLVARPLMREVAARVRERERDRLEALLVASKMLNPSLSSSGLFTTWLTHSCSSS